MEESSQFLRSFVCLTWTPLTILGASLCESSDEEQLPQLDQALHRLLVREILVLHENAGWSYEQLASTLNLLSDTVMSGLSRSSVCGGN
jgi:DNA-directed RNA polymerase specialized sigma24 family protein